MPLPVYSVYTPWVLDTVPPLPGVREGLQRTNDFPQKADPLSPAFESVGVLEMILRFLLSSC